MRHLAPALAVLAAFAAAPAMAQSGERLSGKEITQLISDKALEFRHRKRPVGDIVNPTAWEIRHDGAHTVVTLFFRGDGSLSRRCQTFLRDGRQVECRGTEAGRRDVGLWSVEGTRLCNRYVETRAGGTHCLELWREGDKYRIKQVSGPRSPIDGELAEFK